MHSFMWYGRRFGGAILIGALVPAIALAQAATPPAKADSAAAAAATTHTAAGKRSRLGSFGRAALNKANGAADKVAQTTGVSKETMAKVALAGTGVGAATMLMHSDSAAAGLGGAGGAGGVASSVASNVAAAAGQSMFQKLKGAKAAHAAGAGAAAAGMPDAAAMAAAGMNAQQMALYRQQMALAQANAMQASAMQASAMPSAGSSAEMLRLQNEYTQIAMRASAGDKAATQQMMRFSQEWSGAVMRLQGLPPAQQQAAYEAALRDALTCATKGKSCKS